MFSEIFYLRTQRIVTLILVHNTLCANSLGSWLGISVPLYNIPMAKRTLNFQKYLELNPVVFINMLGRYIKISTDSYHCRICTPAFAQFQWVSRKNLSRLPETCHPFYCLSPFHKKAAGSHQADPDLTTSRTHRYTAAWIPSRGEFSQVRNALTSNVKRMCSPKNIQSSIGKTHPHRDAYQ